MQQLEFLFYPEENKIQDQLVKLNTSIEKVRKGVFKRTSDLSSKIDSLEYEIQSLKHQLWIIEKSICKNKS